jgi:hypothetical protein
MWQKLIALEQDAIWRGSVFRFPAKYPYESVVDYMVIEDTQAESGLSILVSSGYKAGIRVQMLPIEALVEDNRRAISKDWLVRNWQKWVYQKCDVEDVLYTEGYQIE